ncbi:hypothetical protein AMELA_G00047500 [Ameiurus melas]|uniref:Uncharacterized protein n=1 Tax=Ameiurus melas TaxID=219545 RepID=A0A7J6B4X0_AMEME|nr:hypothetical protein AMELA_G00047500 [Ameiurus melas]
MDFLVSDVGYRSPARCGDLDATKAAFCAVRPEEDGGSWMKKCVSFGAVGAFVNMVHRGGVIAQLQREAGRHIIPIHYMFEEISSLSLTLQKNDRILPQATPELRKIVIRLEALQFRAKAGGMLEKIQTMLAQQQGDERTFQGITLKGNPQLKQHIKAAINIGMEELKARPEFSPLGDDAVADLGATWLQFRAQLQEHVEVGTDYAGAAHFSRSVNKHQCLLQFRFQNILQADLDECVELWNKHRIRPSRLAVCSGEVPNELVHPPHRSASRDCGLKLMKSSWVLFLCQG